MTRAKAHQVGGVWMYLHDTIEYMTKSSWCKYVCIYMILLNTCAGNDKSDQIKSMEEAIKILRGVSDDINQEV
jgi:hypothetical protein